MSQKTAAQILVESLEINGFNRAFGVPGESYLDLLNALYDSPIEYITCRHEGGAAMAACAHGQITGRPGLCMVTRGPGATNASSGLHVAKQGSVPMLLLIGQVSQQERHREAFQEINYEKTFVDLSKWTAEIHDPERIPEYIARAVQILQSGDPGPVVLALPEDMLAASCSSQARLAVDPVHPSISDAQIEVLQEMLACAKRPFMLVGGIGWEATSSAALAEFAEANQIPVAFSFRSQDCLDNTHSCAVGPLGLGANRAQCEHIQQADLILVNGARVGHGVNGIDEVLENRTRANFVHLHPDSAEPGRLLRPDLGVQVSPVEAALRMQKLRSPVTAERRAWRARCREIFEEFSTPQPDDYLGSVITAMHDALPKETVVCNGAGNACAWLHRFFQYRQPGTALGPVSGSMGFDIPAALAVALEYPQKPVVAWAGDGSFLMTCQELATACQYGAAFIAIIVDNGLYGTIRMYQERKFPGRVCGTEIINPDFVVLAESFGAYGERVERLDDFVPALQRCIAAQRPSIIHLPVDPRRLSPDLIAAA